MKSKKSVKLGARLITSFVIVALISLVVGVVGLTYIKEMMDNTKKMYDVDTKPMSQIASVAIGFKQIQMDMRDVLITEDVMTKASIAGKIPASYVSIEGKLEEYGKSIDDSGETTNEYNKVKELIEQSKGVQQQITSLGQEGKTSEAVQLFEGQWSEMTTELEASINRIFNIAVTDAEKTVQENQDAAMKSFTTMGLIIGFAIVLALIIGIYAAYSITKPIKKLAQAADRLALGDVEVEIDTRRRDEIGQLSKSFSSMAQSIKAMSKSVEKVAEGDLDVEIDIKSDKDVLAIKLREMTDTIKNLLEGTNSLTKEAIEGNLGARVDVSSYSGAWHVLANGINDVLEAVTEPLKEAREVMAQMAEGEFNIAVMGDYRGDHGAIKDSLNTTIDTIREYFGELKTILEEIAKGNLDISIEKEWKGNFSDLKNELNVIIEALNDTMGQINNASEQVAIGSKQLSNSSQDLSQGATQQASSAQEITAAMAQITSQTKQNTINAINAKELSHMAKENAEQGNSKMNDMLRAMNEINESSRNISKIIKVIDEIARQTNILALNAAVEAARAGHQGKGFAVVAEEVRNLASRSAKAARETTLMIESSIDRVQGGTAIADETAQALERIVEDTSKAAALVEQIALASKEQEAGISQVNESIDEVSRITQMNTATAEQSAASSQELSSQAHILQQRISSFKLKNTEE